VFYFTHFWGKGSTEQLARAFRAALDAQAKPGATPPPAATK